MTSCHAINSTPPIEAAKTSVVSNARVSLIDMLIFMVGPTFLLPFARETDARETTQGPGEVIPGCLVRVRQKHRADVCVVDTRCLLCAVKPFLFLTHKVLLIYHTDLSQKAQVICEVFV